MTLKQGTQTRRVSGHRAGEKADNLAPSTSGRPSLPGPSKTSLTARSSRARSIMNSDQSAVGPSFTADDTDGVTKVPPAFGRVWARNSGNPAPNRDSV